MPMRTIKATITVSCLLAALPLIPGAAASTKQRAIFQDDKQLLTRGPAIRDEKLDELRALGVDTVKFYIPWSEIAPQGPTKPAGYNGADLASYAEARWEAYDGLVRAATERGFQLLVAPSTPAPGWATSTRGDAVGVTRPNPIEFGKFVQAVGTRYDGKRRDAAGNPLPRVSFWTIGNEPNHPMWLQPLGSESSKRAISPELYRNMVRQAVLAFGRSGHKNDTILFGELLPIGSSRYGARNNVQPVEFLREFFCLDANHEPYRGSQASVRGCLNFRQITGVKGFAMHPYTRASGPRGKEPTKDDATIRSLDRLERVLDKAAAQGRLARKKIPIYVTEFGYQSNPPDPFQVDIAKIPGYLNEAEWMAWRDDRVASWAQYLLVDDVLNPGTGNDRFSRFQTGLRFEDFNAKPGVYDAYRLPLFVTLRGSRTVEVWGAARPVPGLQVRIEQRLGETEPFTVAAGGEAVQTNSRGYFMKRLTIPSAAKRSFRFSVQDGSIERFSRETPALKR